MNKTLRYSASLILAVVLALGVFSPGRATSQNAVLMPERLVNLAFFYKPPSNTDAATLAGNFTSVVLTGGDENFRDQLRANGFTSAIPQYFRWEGIQDPGSCTANPANNQVGYKPGDFCDISQNHSDWFMLDTNGNRMRTSPTSNYYRMDPGNAGWRQFFVSRLLEMNQQKGWSGVFLDNLEANLSEIQRDGITPARYPANTSYQTAVKGFLQYLDQNYAQPYGHPVVANIISRSTEAEWFNYTPYLTGAMQERWSVGWNSPDYVSESKWNGDMLLAERTQAQGKFIILVAQGNQTDTNRQKFAFASYLLIANGKAAFRYGNEDIYNQAWLYDNYRVNLGTPLGARYRSGTTWRRDFTNGYVIVDPVSHAATISTSAASTPTSTRTPTLAVTNTSTNIPATPTRTPTGIPATATRTPTSVPATATWTPTQVPTITPTVATVTYNDLHSAFVYSSNWLTIDDAAAYQSEFKRTQVIGSSVTFTFTGTKFSVIYKMGPLFGKMAVYVDGTLIATIDQYSSTVVNQRKWIYGGTLTSGSHTLRFVYTSGPTDGRISVDAVSIP